MSKIEQQGAGAPSVLEIHLLGPFRIMVDGRPVEGRRFGRRKPKLLVQLLTLQPHHQLHREQVMELLWPDSDPEAAANSLHKAIHMARHALEPELKSGADSRFIITQSQQVILRAPQKLWIDVDAFEERAARAVRSADVEAYEAALSLYAGDLLIEDPYEDWAAPRREQLRQVRQDLLSGAAHVYEAEGSYRQSIERLRELLDCDPTNEEVHRRLMRLYALTGNRRQALRQYRQCAETVSRELATEPDRETAELHRQIASGRIKPLPSGGGAAAAARPRRTPPAL
jgi:DNA-binding SARP family transcriptional activator